jgi:tripartite-type tricarboxylate transporter receptor subunit TctC
MINHTRRKICSSAVFLPLLSIHNQNAIAQAAFPNRSIRIVVPYPGGDGTDVVTRLLAQQMSKDLKFPVIIENRPGAAGLTGALSVATGNADGYSMTLMSSGHITHQTLYKKLDLLGQFAPLTNLATAPFAFIVPPNSPYRTLAELIKGIKENQGRLTMGTGGLGSPAQMAFEVFRTSLGGSLEINHIPYKSGLESTLAVVANQVDFASAYIGSVLPQAKAGKVRVLAMTSAKRISGLPDAPTVAELLLPNWEYNTLLFFAVPRKTPTDNVATLFRAITEASKSPELLTMLDSLAHRLELNKSPLEFEQQLRVAIDSETKLIRDRGIKVDS